MYAYIIYRYMLCISLHDAPCPHAMVAAAAGAPQMI